MAVEPPNQGLYDAHMREALALAQAAAEAGDVPVGAVVVSAEGLVIGRGENRRERHNDPTAHAEIIALREAAENARSWRLIGATVVVTLEPCAMCAGALVNARVSRVVYACADPKAGALDTLFTIGRDVRLNHRFEVVSGVLEAPAASQLRSFFAERRKRPSKSYSSDSVGSGTSPDTSSESAPASSAPAILLGREEP